VEQLPIFNPLIPVKQAPDEGRIIHEGDKQLSRGDKRAYSSIRQNARNPAWSQVSFTVITVLCPVGR
jgi:hypothetical protein